MYIERYTPPGSIIYPAGVTGSIIPHWGHEYSPDHANKGDFSACHAVFGTIHGINGLYHSYSVYTVSLIFSLVLTHS